ncbi:hypothetical protein [Pseudoalteromonas fuliginea]|uniref:Uncharacterized protein n=1 Tax=Pseudoalteromonas fuliginea TaxID=1872678 RepID=A0ABQ6RN81_9GAMM|nr:hypothetical protein [Pseudoalteromonas fuliginea]KAA1166116.1 hypothetical protein EU509_00685 [Pseudoalteromonas fuliginea]KAA1169758.1 hypothetical protein EUZ79_00795 [Pseudoalteromonas fuliginea]
MSRIVISNDEKVFDSLVKENIKSGVELSNVIKRAGLYFASFYKRVKKNENFFESDNSDFILGCGTLIYNDSTSSEALEGIISNYEQSLSIRDNIFGNYSIVLSKDSVVTVFCDPYSIHDIYYYEENGTFAICNSLKELTKVKSNKSVKVSSLISETILSGYIGNETFIEGIFKLRGTEKLILQSEELSIVDVNYQKAVWNFEGKTVDDAVDTYVNLIKKYTSKIAKVWGEIGVHQTGGLDNRLIFSGLIDAGVKPLLLYGKGNGILTTTNQEDLECVKQYSKKFDLKHHIMDWGHNETDYSLNSINSLFNKYGFKFAIYGAPKSFFSEYEGGIPDYPDFLEFGYFGENLRLREYLDGRDSISLDDFFEDYLFGGRYGDINNPDFLPQSMEIKRTLRAEYLKEASLFGLNIDTDILAKDFDEFRWVHARKADSRSLNLINEFTSSFATLSVPELHEFPWSLPAEWRENAQFQLRVIHRLYPQSLTVPIFSHGNLQTLNKNNFSLTINYTWAQKVKSLMDVFNASSKVINYSKEVYFRFFERNKEKAKLALKNKSSTEYVVKKLESYFENECPKELSFIVPKHYPGHIVGLYRYYLHIRALEEVEKNN